MLDDTDREWEIIGKNDPYFGVITNEKYSKDNLNNERIEEFFDSGYAHIDKILTRIKKYIDPNFEPKRALDFGCGVGRLVIPLSGIADYVVGVDVSDSMLKEAIINCKNKSIINVKFIKGDDNLSKLTGSYNFIHSYIVFQHIPIRRGMHLFERLLELLENDGIGVIHITYSKVSKIKVITQWIKSNIPLVNNIYNIVKGKKFFHPNMQMNSYDLNKILSLIHKKSIRNIYAELTDHSGDLGIILYFKKNSVS
jgi:SAM-dependent methyltransferase